MSDGGNVMRIAIIGGGASGALTSMHLARALPPGAAEITVIELAEEIGRGLAYTTDDLASRAFAQCARRKHECICGEAQSSVSVAPKQGTARRSADAVCFIFRSISGTYMANIVQELSGSGGRARSLRRSCADW